MKTKLIGVVIAAAVAVVFGVGLVSAETEAVVAKLDTKPGPAFQMIEGKLKNIDGNTYVVEEVVDNYRGEVVPTHEVRVYVGKDTKRLHGNKKIGDKIRVEMTRGGFANAIQ
jgi:hypothetical protein